MQLSPVSSDGLLDLQAFEALLTPDTALVSIPFANGEIGAVQPIDKVVAAVRRVCPSAFIHCDASQALGKVPVHPMDLDIDLLTIAGHKVYAPKGIGALYIRKGLQLSPLILGGGQERGLRGGTENVAFAMALGTACKLIKQSWEAAKWPLSPEAISAAAAAAAASTSVAATNGKCVQDDPPHPSKLAFVAKVFVDRLWASLEAKTSVQRQKLGSALRLNGPLGAADPSVQQQWLPGTIHLSVRGAYGFDIAKGLAEEERVFVSAGVSCHQGKTVSGTLLAMGHSSDWALGSLRISVGRDTSVSDAVKAAEKMATYLINHKLLHL
ncbi:cysteine desulfurase, putative [Eimeria maxima]|uniref:cysteine desulfurase n=1 Tax=Eimeria maxima TaxID=5804 RepID=U6M6G4_EIMMA|nr:cysteine desulfurase, putative [Eimeria maxima]CDJ59827.1 cysteine desulfurase, putative [Eimeria maxima]